MTWEQMFVADLRRQMMQVEGCTPLGQFGWHSWRAECCTDWYPDGYKR